MSHLVDIIGGLLILAVLIVVIALHGRNTQLDKKYFEKRWNKLQKLCSNSKMWFQAIIDADDLLDEALKKKHFRGRTTGERLVSAQHHFSSNDSIWFSHKLTNKIRENGVTKVNKKQTLEALASYRLALIELGALNTNGKSKASNG